MDSISLTRAELDTMLKEANRKVWRMNMASQRMKNPSLTTARRQSDFYRSLIKTFGESEGKSMWIAYVRSLKEQKNEVRKANKGARLWLRYLKAVDRLMKHQGL